MICYDNIRMYSFVAGEQLNTTWIW